MKNVQCKTLQGTLYLATKNADDMKVPTDLVSPQGKVVGIMVMAEQIGAIWYISCLT